MNTILLSKERGKMGAKFNVVDLFGAPGGLALGFRETGLYKIVACVDHDKIAANTYQKNIKAEIITSGIENVTAEKLLEVGQVKRNEIDIVIGGPPCPGFSVVGRVKIASLVETGKWYHMNNSEPRFIDDPRNLLYKHFVRIVEELKPKFFVMENVFGMVSHNNGETVKHILEDFSNIGYMTNWKVLNAVNYGVPQERRRIFFIGNRIGSINPFPAPAYRSPRGSKNPDKKLKNSVTVWEAIGDLPRLLRNSGENQVAYGLKPFSKYQRWARRRSKLVFNHVARGHAKRDLKIFKYLRAGMKWKDLPPELKNMYGYRDDIFQDKMKRLRKNRPSWTITAHLSKDGYMYIHPTQNRTITVREAARFQSFPDNFIFFGSRSSQFKQVGNAVPPLLAKAVASTIASCLRVA